MGDVIPQGPKVKMPDFPGGEVATDPPVHRSGGLSASEGMAVATEKAERYFPCPHCGNEIDRLQLVTFWNEWGRICDCPSCGTEPDCPAFPPTQR